MQGVYDLSPIYLSLLENNATLFQVGMLQSAYHALSSALHIAFAFQRSDMVAEIEQRAKQQYEAITTSFADTHPSTSTEVLLYRSLLENLATGSRLLPQEPEATQ